MAYKGQIMTVSDVFINGTVDEYILGADANVFQTNYDSNGVLTDWTIDHPYNYIKSNMYGFYYFFGHNTPRMRAKIGSSSMKLGGNAQTDDTDSEYPFIYMDYDLNKHITINGGNSSLRILKDSIDLNVGYSSINMNYESMSLGSNNNIISFERNKRPYFGTCASNYVVSNNDLEYGLENHNHNDLYNSNYYVYATIGGRPGVDSHKFSVIDRRVGDGTTVFQTNINGFSLVCGTTNYMSAINGFNSNYGLVLSYSNGTTHSDINITDELSLISNQNQIIIGGSRISLYANASNQYGLSILDNGSYPAAFYFDGLEAVSTGTPALFGNVVTNGGNAYFYAQAGSSKRFKNSIRDLIEDSIKADKLYNLPVRQFKYNDNILRKNDCCYNKLIPGFIAEEVNKYYPIATVYNQKENGQLEVENWDVRYIVPPMLKLIQDQHQEIETLKTEIAEIKELLKNK